ncbi:MAG: hypothetical protein IKQ59_07080, partial [Prevotella sp.]|nr:hypothetical protein [Prevotella sp.]
RGDESTGRAWSPEGVESLQRAFRIWNKRRRCDRQCSVTPSGLFFTIAISRDSTPSGLHALPVF